MGAQVGGQVGNGLGLDGNFVRRFNPLATPLPDILDLFASCLHLFLFLFLFSGACSFFDLFIPPRE